MEYLRIAYENLPLPVFWALWTLLWALIVAGVGIAVREVAFRLNWWASYRYDRNPYTRVCRRCGQRQDCFHYRHGVDRWEPMGVAIKDEKCACNR